MNRRKIKNRIAFKIWTAVTRVEKYNTCAAIQILVTICFISFCDDSFTWGQSNLRRLIYERSVTNIRDRSLAYSFICLISNWFEVLKVQAADILLLQGSAAIFLKFITFSGKKKQIRQKVLYLMISWAPEISLDRNKNLERYL